MAFIVSGSTVISFASSDALQELDQRLFEQNEGLAVDYLDDQLVRSTARILSLLRATDWWQQYYMRQSQGSTPINSAADIPALDPARIQAREDDFTDLCCYYALYNYILPHIADFGNEDSAERRKMGYYQQKYDQLFAELITAGDWYNFDNTDGITSQEKQPGVSNLRRVR
jgi:hypothetical protein